MPDPRSFAALSRAMQSAGQTRGTPPPPDDAYWRALADSMLPRKRPTTNGDYSSGFDAPVKVPDETVRQVLLSYGYRPDAVDWIIQNVPVEWAQQDLGDLARQGRSVYSLTNNGPVIRINDRVASNPIRLGEAVRHEAQHGVELTPSSPYLGPSFGMGEMDALSDPSSQASTPQLATAVSEILSRPGDYGRDDPAHYRTGILEGLGFDYGAIPEPVRREAFPFLDPAVVGRPEAPYGEPHEDRSLANDEQQRFANWPLIGEAQYRQTPWWMDTYTYDPSQPPSTMGAYDRLAPYDPGDEAPDGSRVIPGENNLRSPPARGMDPDSFSALLSSISGVE